MQESILEMAVELVGALIAQGGVPPEAMDGAVREIYETLRALQARQSGEAVPAGSPPEPSGWRTSISRHAITCLECGAVYKQLSKRHLREHELTARAYRAKYGIPPKVPLAARETTARRRAAVAQTRPWEKTPRYLADQAGGAAKKKAAGKRGRRS